MEIIGLVGRAGAGKTTVATHLVQKYGYRKLAFADPLKQMLIAAGLCTWAECYAEKTERSRELLQKVGTDIFRKQVDPLFWVKRTALAVGKYLEAGHKVVLDDIRFPEEAAMVRSCYKPGMLIRILRGDYVDLTAGTAHESESMVNAIDVDHIVLADSGDLDQLLWQVDQIMERQP